MTNSAEVSGLSEENPDDANLCITVSPPSHGAGLYDAALTASQVAALHRSVVDAAPRVAAELQAWEL